MGVQASLPHVKPTRIFPWLLVLLCTSAPALAQNPDLILSQAERDSILKDYDSFFPIWGRQAIERGFDLPRAFGIGFNAVYITQNIDIDNLLLSTDADPLEPINAIQFGTTTADAFSETIRADLWVFPFLNVYGLAGPGQAKTSVEVTTPIGFTSEVDQKATTYGVGLTGAMGIKRNWLSVDVNWTWSDLEKLEDPVMIRILGLRYGRAIKLSGRKRLAIWVGTMNQKVELETRGSVRFDEAVPPEFWDDVENIPSTPWYAGLTPAEKAVVDRFLQRILASKATTINYGLDKSLSDPWNMLVGSQLTLSKSWELRAEAGFIGRLSILVGLNYRLGF
jgi:hypothetical protein